MENAMKKNNKLTDAQPAKLSKQKEKTQPFKKADTLRLIHELQTHQIELELQNEALIQARAEVEEVSRQHSDLYNFAPVGYFTLARDGTIRNVNLAGANLLGMERANLIDRRMGLFVSDEFRPIFTNFLEKLLSGAGKETNELAFLKNGNKLLWVRLEASCFEGGQESRVVLVDISERVQAEKALRESENRYRELIEFAVDGILIGSKDGIIIGANSYMLNLTGRTLDNLIGNHVNILFSPDELKRVPFQFDLLQKGETVMNERNLIRPDEKVIPVEMHTKMMTNGTYQSIYRDITERNQADEALRISEERYHAMVSNVPVVMFVTDQKGIFTLSEGKGLEKLNLQPGQVVGLSVFDVYRDYPSILNALKSALAGHSQRIVVEVQGSVFDAHFSCMFDQHGKVLNVIGVSIDITEQVQAQEALKQNEALYHLLADHMTDVIWLRDLNLNLTYVSPSEEKIRGYTLAELQQFPFDQLLTPASVQLAMELFTVEIPKVLADPAYSPVVTREFEFYKRDGTLHSVESKMSIIRDESGNPLSILGQDRDIIERKQMEKMLRESELRNRAMVEAIPDLMFVQNRKGVYLDYHATNHQLLVAPPEYFLGRTTREVVPSAQVDALQFKFELAFQTSEIQSHEYALDLADGTHYFEARMNAYDDDRLLSIVREVTDSKLVQQKLKVLEEFQRVLLDAAELTTILLLDCTGTILIANKLATQHIGKQLSEIMGVSIHNLYSKEIADLKMEQINKVCRTAVAVHFEDFRGGKWSENSLYPILDTTGKVARIAVYARDITERKLNEKLLRKSEQRYRALAEASHDFIYVIDSDDRIIYANSYVSMQFGVEPDALVGQLRSRWFGTFDANDMREKLDRVFETGSPVYTETETIFSGSILYLSTWLIPLENQNGVVDSVLGVSRDISELKKLENSLKITNQELEAKVEKRTDELRVSHNDLHKLTHQIVVAQEDERRRISRELHDEAGQSLIGLRFSMDAIYRELPANLGDLRRRMAKALTLIDQAVKRIRALAYNLRPPMLDLMGVNLGIKELCREYSEQTGIEVEYFGIDFENLQDEISISLYRFVQEALTNVAKHARASKVQVTLEYQNEMIKVSVQDNGRGIPADMNNKGLGMVGIKERFDNLGGWMELKPVIPSGSQLLVYLPWKNITEM
jgi:PAS domain S-box-containing protein